MKRIMQKLNSIMETLLLMAAIVMKTVYLAEHLCFQTARMLISYLQKLETILTMYLSVIHLPIQVMRKIVTMLSNQQMQLRS